MLSSHFVFYCILRYAVRHLLEDKELNRANISRGFLFPLMALNLHFTSANILLLHSFPILDVFILLQQLKFPVCLAFLHTSCL